MSVPESSLRRYGIKDGVLTMICAILNYAPNYRQAIFSLMDRTFDIQFCFGKEVLQGQGTMGIPGLDWSIFRRIPIEIRNRELFGRIPWRSGVVGLAFRKEFDVYLVSGDFNWAYIPFLLVCRLMGKKVYGWGHGLKTFGKSAFFKKLMYKLMDGYFIYGDQGKKRMVELGFPSGKFYPVHNSLVESLDRSRTGRLRSDVYAEHFGNALPVLLFSGRLTPVKRVDMFLEMIARLNAEGLGCNAVVVGDGPLMSTLREMSSGLGLNVWFRGECYDKEELSRLVYNADLCVSPGNVGLFAVESMMYGTPMVSHGDFETQMPEYETIVEGYTGSLYKSGDLDSLVSVVKGWLSAGHDREAVRKACYDVIEAGWTASWQLEVFKEHLA